MAGTEVSVIEVTRYCLFGNLYVIFILLSPYHYTYLYIQYMYMSLISIVLDSVAQMCLSGPVVQRVDNVIQWVIAIQWISVNKTYCAIHWIAVYPLGSVIHPSKNRGLVNMAMVMFC